ncbi:ferredoxin [Chthonomonas calidirosea]|uniref:2Fe-2S iron-sulfur cluster-binding protein n=1 Tax=Chthonomonas calidirosea TaxID=454171 RepID=UPI0006DD3F7C|nr:2Fe-2S iron-sulfur cluster-binding protein [Chthonomonas calidirosea]CEK13409.1 ferredoxin [Chthonomonas calidirosea]
MKAQVEIIVEREGVSLEEEKGSDVNRILAVEGYTLLDALLETGIALPHECGGNCACTTCRVFVEAGAELLSPMEEAERDRLILENVYQPRIRLACQALIRSPNNSLSSDLRIKLRIPPS